MHVKTHHPESVIEAPRIWDCGGLNVKCPHRLGYLNTWPSDGGAAGEVMGPLGDRALLEKGTSLAFMAL